MKLSIVTPSFRQADFLELCARSVADQGGDFSHEHLIQDGGGGQDFEKWASEQTFANVRSEPDGGMYDAINKGFARATGDIIAWLNCDEQYLPGALEKVAAWFAQNPGKDILFGDVVLVDASGHPLAYRQVLKPMRKHIKSCFLATFSAATFLRRSVIEKGHWLDTRYRSIADAVWIDSLLGAGFQTGVLNEPLAVFTQTGVNLGQSQLSFDEASRWKKETKSGSSWQRALWSGAHRIQKLVLGGYRRREIRIQVYTKDAAYRQEFVGAVGGRWQTASNE